LNVEPIKI
jgi:hypothetical protein